MKWLTFLGLPAVEPVAEPVFLRLLGMAYGSLLVGYLIGVRSESYPDATVTVNGEPAGSTNVDGLLRIGIPSDSEELEIVAILGDADGELEVKIQ